MLLPQMYVLYGINRWKLELAWLRAWDVPRAVQDSTGIPQGRCDRALVGNFLGIWAFLSRFIAWANASYPLYFRLLLPELQGRACQVGLA